MCGIMGYVGSKVAWDVVLGGLKRLEYRGYDSAGIATIDQGELQRERRIGPLRVLEQAKPRGLPGQVGLGHTRWATHGGVTEANCHPHFDSHNRVALVHNGILDNVEELRRDLMAQGVRFRSETDSEVLAELIGRGLSTPGASLVGAVVQALKRVEGTAGIIAMDRDDPGRLVAARIGSPVVVGLGDGECWVASDALALRPHTDRMIVLEENEVAELAADGVKTFDLDLRDRDNRVQKILHAAEEADLSGYAHFMLKEIHEQPAAIDRSLRGRLDPSVASVRLGGLQGHEARLHELTRVVFFGAGSSLIAGQIGAYLMNRHARIPASAEDAAELLTQNPIVEPRTLYVAISQSGETADTLATLRELRLRGALVAGIANVAGSSLSRETDFGIYTHAGPEVSVASTKAFTSQLVAAQLLALRFARLRGLSADQGRTWLSGLGQLAQRVQTMLEHAPTCRALAERFQSARFTMFVGRGSNLPVASEGALKLKEVAYVPAEGVSGAAMKHGPLALVEPGTPVWALVPPDETRERMLGNLRELAARGASLIVVADAGDQEAAQLADTLIALPPHHPALSSILTVVPLQLYAYYTALARDCAIDRPRNLAKSVTVT
ncbi:MAG: glutamine--fructose-6-phosphate transaminase (isomerizing) [Myxococcales bacterium]